MSAQLERDNQEFFMPFRYDHAAIAAYRISQGLPSDPALLELYRHHQTKFDKKPITKWDKIRIARVLLGDRAQSKIEPVAAPAQPVVLSGQNAEAERRVAQILRTDDDIVVDALTYVNRQKVVGESINYDFLFRSFPQDDGRRARLIVRVFSTLHNIDIKTIRSNARHKSAIAIRMEVVYWIVATTDMSYAAVGRLLNRDHTTIRNAVRSHAKNYNLPLLRDL